MKESEMLKDLAERTTAIFEKNKIEKKLTPKELSFVLEAYTECILEALKKNKKEKVTFPCVGSFTAKYVKERTGKSALTGKEWEKPEHYELKFTVSNSLKTLE